MSLTEFEASLKASLQQRHGSCIEGVTTRRVVDSTGDPAIWIWVILHDAELLERDDRSAIESIRTDAERAAREFGSEWPYVTFRTAAEQSELDAAEVKRG